MHLQIPLEPEGKVHLYIELKPALQGKHTRREFRTICDRPWTRNVFVSRFFLYLVIVS